MASKNRKLTIGRASRNLVEAGMGERKKATSYLKQLENIGILKVHKVGEENLYLNKALLKVLSK